MLDNASYSRENPDYNKAQQLRAELDESHRFLQVLLNVMDLATQVEDPSEFITKCLETICVSTKQTIGVAWVLDRSSNRLVYRSHVDMHRIETSAFIEASKDRVFEKGEGLPGEVWEKEKPLWVSNISKNRKFARQDLASKAGLRSSFAFPIKTREDVIGVFEFYGRNFEYTDSQAVELANRLGMYLGSVFERKDAELNLREIQQNQRRLEQQLRATADEAINSARLKSEFVANVSHEIRTPLAGVMGMAELLATQDGMDDEAREIANFILSSSHSLLAIVNDLLDFSKLEAGKLSLYKTQFRMKDVIDEVERSARVTANKKGLTVRTDLDPNIPQELFGDPARLMQILINFSANAIKFTEKGEVVIAATLEACNGNNARVRISVSDTGIGISPEAQKRLFEPFVQADGSTTRKYGGTGLGLSIAKKLSSLMSGEIGLQSKEGKGSTFYVIVPLELTDEDMVG